MQFAEVRTSTDQPAAMDRELITFTKYLTKRSPNAYLAQQYHLALAARGLASDDDFSAFDRLTLGLARRSPLCARLADAYCAVLHRQGALRRKLILHLAIVEHTAPYSDALERSPTHSVSGAIGLVILEGARFALSFTGGAVLLLPAHLMFAVTSRRNKNQGARP